MYLSISYSLPKHLVLALAPVVLESLVCGDSWVCHLRKQWACGLPWGGRHVDVAMCHGL